MSFIKHHWFGAFVGILLICFVCVFVLVLLVPKQDMRGRGFIPCTENMVEELFECDRNIWCSTKVIFHNNICVLSVIGMGVKNWIKGEQSFPWSNYIFEPELYPEGLIDEEARRQYLAEHPDVKAEMDHLHLLRKDIENENNKESNPEIPWQEEK